MGANEISLEESEKDSLGAIRRGIEDRLSQMEGFQEKIASERAKEEEEQHQLGLDKQAQQTYYDGLATGLSEGVEKLRSRNRLFGVLESLEDSQERRSAARKLRMNELLRLCELLEGSLDQLQARAGHAPAHPGPV